MNLFKQKLKVINTGLESFSKELKQNGVETIQVDWKPSVISDDELLDKISDNKSIIDEANKKALDIILRGQPNLIGMDIAINVIPGMKKNLILHAGPPVTWEPNGRNYFLFYASFYH